MPGPLTRREFEEAAHTGRPSDVSEAALRLALATHARFAEGEVFRPQHLSDLYNAAREIDGALAAGDGRRELSALSHTALAEYDGAKMLEVIARAVGYLRGVVFGSEAPPFAGDDDGAKAWVWREEAKRESPHHRAEREKVYDELLEVWQRLEELGDLREIALPPWFMYPRPDGTLNVVSARSGPLYRLVRAAHHLARASGFDRGTLLHYILTGTEPTLPRSAIRVRPRDELVYTARRPGELFGSIVRTEVTITLRATDVTDEELRELVRAALAYMGGRERPRFTEDDLRLLGIAEELGHDPEETGAWSLTGIWADAARLWQEETGETLTPRALSNRYRRLLKRKEKATGVKVATMDYPDEEPDNGD